MAAYDPVPGSAVSDAWLTTTDQNSPTGAQVANPVYPGPVTEDHAGGPESVAGRSPIPYQETGAIPPDAGADEIAAGGGGYPERNYSGHAGPIADFASQVLPFAPPGAIPPTHAIDTGGVERHSRVSLPVAKGWMRRVLDGMTYDNLGPQNTDNLGFRQLAPTGRTDLDQYQAQNADAYDPFLVPYSERPILANLAAETQPLTTPPDAYTPSGDLPDMTPTGGQGDAVYEAPSDPPVNSAVSPVVAAGADVGWF
jgi:hypothetical protein